MVELIDAVTQNWRKFRQFSDRSQQERFDEINAHLTPGISFSGARVLVGHIHTESQIGLDELDRDAMAMQTRALASVLRFLGDPHVAEKHADNVAKHSFRVIVTGDELLRHEPKDATNIELRQIFQLSTIAHDFGEMVREFGSFAKQLEAERGVDATTQLSVTDKQRIKDEAQKTIFNAEHKISEFSTKLAYASALLKQPELHHNTILEMRKLSGVNADGTLDKNNPLSPKDAIATINHYIDTFVWPDLTREQTETVSKRSNTIMRYYDMAESFLGVVGPIVKTMQKADGSDYIYQVMGKDGAVPYDLSWNWRILGAHGRNEGGLGTISKHADLSRVQRFSDLAQKWMIARSIDLIKKNPDVVSRAQDVPEAAQAGSDDMRTAKATLLKGLSGKSSRGMDNPLKDDILTARRALIVYMAAYTAIGSAAHHLDDRYRPGNTPLMLERELPEKLKEHVRLLDHFQRMLNYPTTQDMDGKILLKQLKKEIVDPHNPAQINAFKDLLHHADFIFDTFQDFKQKRLDIRKRYPETSTARQI